MRAPGIGSVGRVRVSLTRVGLLLTGLLSTGCGGAASSGDAEPPVQADSLPAADAASPPVSADADAPPGTIHAEPPGPTLLGEGAPREYRLLLVNRLEGMAVVFASAGAGRVALDTVPGRDSVYVDVRVRADRVLLEAEDESGRRVSADSVDLVPAGPNRWEIPSSGRDRAATAGAAGL